MFARAQAPFDERLSLVSLLLAGLNTRFAASRQADAVADACYAFLRETKKGFATLPEDIPDGSAELFSQQIKDYEAETQRQRDAGLLGQDELTNRLQVQAALRQWEGELRRANAAGTRRRPLTCCAVSSGRWQTSARPPRRPPPLRWKQPSTLWSRPLRKARRWWCSSPSLR